jgi:hypothetical protein
MTETTVESIFGTKAGIVWGALHKNGPSNIGNLVKTTSLSREEVYAALGWLGRENKIIVERRGRAMVFSLRETEARLEAFKGTKIADSAPQGQAQPNANIPPEKTTRTRKVKAPSSALEVVKKALDVILSEFEGNCEPTPMQVSKEVGMDSRQLGKALSRLDIKSKSIRREGKAVRIYPLELKARVWELAALDAEGLQKMSEAKSSVVENERERNRGNFTVFD